MRVLITGAGGFIGATLTAALLQGGVLKNARGESEAIDEIMLLDTHLPPISDPRLARMQADMSDRKSVV